MKATKVYIHPKYAIAPSLKFEFQNLLLNFEPHDKMNMADNFLSDIKD